MKFLSGMWKKVSTTGNTYLRAHTNREIVIPEGSTFAVMKNNFKDQDEKQADYKLVIFDKEPSKSNNEQEVQPTEL